jgi:hypothetical protein
VGNNLMTVKINADTSHGLKLESDTSGAIDFQSAGVTKASLDASGNLTATSFVGSGASLTALPSAQLTGALPAIDGSSLTGVGGGGLAVVSAVNEYNASGNTTSYSFTGFDSTYDNYYVIIHGISQQGDGDLQMRFLDDGSAITSSDYRQSTLGLTHNLSEKRITTETATLFTIVEQQKSGQDDTLNGFMYFNNGNGGRWDSDSSDSQGNVSPSFVYQVGCEGSNGTSRIAQGHGYINGTSANACNGFQLIFAGGTGAYKINLTVYGVKRA